MRESVRKLVVIACLALSAVPAARGQFYPGGGEATSVRWETISTQDYRVIYPRGLDSLARVYAMELEKCKLPVSGSIGYAPNQGFKRPSPVILHPDTTLANGSVTWTPHRMELNTTPEAYNPEPTPWPRQLAVHESRHLAQMQFVRDRKHRVLNALTGELWGGLLAALYGGPDFFEGDAVLAETALSYAGRGRSADFLEYYRACFAEGEMRDYYKWRYGSLYGYTPDYYRAGYLMASAMHADTASFRWPFPAMKKPAKQYDSLAVELSELWATEAEARGPFTEGETFHAPRSRFFHSYSHYATLGGRLYAVRYGTDDGRHLVRFDADGQESEICSFSSEASVPKADSALSRLFWSEWRGDPRWGQHSWSIIRFLGPDDRIMSLTHHSRYFNPAPHDGVLAVTEYPLEGGSALVLLSGWDGAVLDRIPAPAGMQIVESCRVDGHTVVSAITDRGFGLYDARDFSCLLGPTPVKIKRLSSDGSDILFVSDLGGVDELYRLSGGSLTRLTSTPQGSSDWALAEDGYLYYSSLCSKGRDIMRVPVSQLAATPADFCMPHKYALAEAQAAAEPITTIDEDLPVKISQPRRYSKIANAIGVHSWLPVYFASDDVDELSSLSITQDAGLGATAFFQNELGTLYGSASVSAWTAAGGFRGAGHLHMTYTGLYPVLELKASIGERDAYNFHFRDSTAEDGTKYVLREADNLYIPFTQASLKAYIPWTFNKAGWNRGIIPQASFSICNDSYTLGSVVPVNRFVTSLRLYATKPIAHSRLYPEWGVGAEAGYSARFGFEDVYVGNVYGFAYAYLPGLVKPHGVKLTALMQKHTGGGFLPETVANTIPRGIRSDEDIAGEVPRWPNQAKLTIDYAIPFGDVDWSFLSPWVYIRNFEFCAHADWLHIWNSKRSRDYASFGADLSVRLGNLLWIPYDTRIGVTYDYCPAATQPHYVGLIFNIDI